ncbi:PREDICTED: integrator complex subunit 3 homolog [Nicrophorus vespilloides]|uniref:SOSS complex subunit A homolog n=1 Tax=Nicrophorus vespilloides TaxID=110193 RepID=A0ABM1M3B5_NICVS|nr:PREDICTED: integrator complex subunit 3 homolog [Nicrophorus vespilloides]
MELAKSPTSKLFVTSAVEIRDEFEEKLERNYQYLQNLTSGLSDKESHDVLNNALLKDKGYDDVSIGLLGTILAEPQNAAKCYTHLTLITRDGMGLVLAHLSQLVLERFLRLIEAAKIQVLWLVKEMIKNAVSNVDNVCLNLMRHAAGGDVLPKNISLIEALLDMFIEYRGWLEKHPVLLPSVIYTYLRIIEDHNAPYLTALRQKEVTFVIGLLRERFAECMVIGRDLVRLLQNVARIPEFEQLWRDILANPKSLSPTFTGVLQLLQTRTSRRYLQSRLTPDMERKLVFLTSQVRFGNHKRYQDWFQRQYLATPESQSLRCDMIRFIVGVIHPTNELLCSEIIPRWAVIGWLLTTCTSTVAVSNAKLALFYDWLFFDSDRDNIMNIEPAILVMHHSMRSHPPVSATLLDFLCRIISNFYPPLADKVRTGIFSSLKQILDKRVLPSLLHLFDNTKLDRDLRNMIRTTFKEFCVQPMESSSKATAEDFGAPKIDGENEFNNHILDSEPAFSDDEEESAAVPSQHLHEDDTDDDDIPLVKLKEKSDKGNDQIIDGPMRSALNRLQSEKEKEKRCQLMEALIEHVVLLNEDSEVIPVLAKALCANVLQEDLKSIVFPNNVNEQTLQDSIRSPVFVIFKFLYLRCTSDDTGKQTLLRLLAEIHNIQCNVGYLLLYFLKIQVRSDQKRDESTKVNTLKISVYKEFCQNVEKKVDNCLYDDLNACHATENNLMLFLVPDLYKDFKQQTVNNAQILRVILSTIDATQLQDLVGKIMQGRLMMFKTDSLQSLLKTSLNWESIEQFFLWQLVQAHDISVESIIPLISHLDYAQHAEALTAITLMLKQEKPTADFVKYLFSRDVRDKGDPLVFTMIRHWCDSYIDKVGELVASLLSTRYPATSPNKRKRSNVKSISSAVPSADQVLGHLDQLRVRCERHNALALYNLDSMQKALVLAQNNSNDSQKKQFSDLFALTEDEDTITTKNKVSRGRKPASKSAAANKRNAKEVSESSEDTSEEEEIVKPKQAKKRKKVMSDSD